MPPAGIERLAKPDHVLDSRERPVRRGLVAKLAHASQTMMMMMINLVLIPIQANL